MKNYVFSNTLIRYKILIFITNQDNAAYHTHSVASGEGTVELPPSEIGKIVGEIWGYLPGVYLLSEMSQKSKKYLVKMWKSQFSIEILITKISNFSWKFSNFLHFWPKRAKLCTVVSKFPCSMEIIRLMLMILRFSTNSSWFSPNIQEFSSHFQ